MGLVNDINDLFKDLDIEQGKEAFEKGLADIKKGLVKAREFVQEEISKQHQERDLLTSLLAIGEHLTRNEAREMSITFETLRLDSVSGFVLVDNLCDRSGERIPFDSLKTAKIAVGIK